MTYLIYGFLLSLNIFLFLLRIQSKIVAGLTLVFIGILFVGESTNPDLINYIRYYNNAPYSEYSLTNGIEVGFLFICKLGNTFGMDFFQLKFWIFILCSILVWRTLKKYCLNYNLLLAFYMTYAMFLDIVQIRNFIALSLFIFAFPYLMHKRRGILKYTIIIIVAALFHSSAILYLIFLIVCFENRRVIIGTCITISIVFVILVIANNNNIPFAQHLLEYTDGARVQRYLSLKINWGYLFVIFLQTLNFIMVFFARKFLLMKESIKNDPIKLGFVNTLYYVNCLIFVLTPLFIISIHFYRIPRNMLILNLVLICMTNQTFKGGDVRRLLMLILVIINVSSWYFIDMSVFIGDPSFIFDAVFKSNLYIK